MKNPISPKHLFPPLIALLSAVTASGDPIVHEPFVGYSAGSILGQAALGTGIEGNWAADLQATAGNISTAAAIETGLTFANLETSGGAVQLQCSKGAPSGNNYVVLGIPTAASIGTVAGDVWSSFLVRPEAYTANPHSINQRVNTTATGLSAASRFAANPDAGTGATVPGVDYIGNSRTDGGNVPTVGNTFLMLAQYTGVNASGLQTATMWLMSEAQFTNWQAAGGTLTALNSRTEGTGVTQLFSKRSNTDTANGTNNAFVGGTGTNIQMSINAATATGVETITFDELRYGNSLEDVLALPAASDPNIGPVAPLNLGNRYLANLPASGNINVANIGATQPLALSNATITGTDAAFFTVTTLPASIAAGANDNIVVSFNSAGAYGAFSAVLNFDSSDVDQPTLTVPLSATVLSDPEIAGVPVAFNLGSFSTVVQPVTRTFTITNNGLAENLVISNATVTGIDAALFSVTAPEPIAPGATGVFTIGFNAAGQAGTFAADLSFTTNDPDESTGSTALSATSFVGFVTAVNTSTAGPSDEFTVLDSVAVNGLGTVNSAGLTNVQVFSFQRTGTAANLLNPGGVGTLPTPRQSLLEDFALNTGIINPGAGSAVATGDTISDAVVGVGVRFNSPIPNGAGTDSLFFEITVPPTSGPPQPADPVTIALLDQNDQVIGTEVTFSAADYLPSVAIAGASTVKIAAGATLNDLNTSAATLDTTPALAHALLELDFTRFGIAADALVHGLFFRSAAVDPTLIVGLRGAPAPPETVVPVLKIESIGDDLVFTWDSIAGYTYALLGDDDLNPAPALWPVVGTNSGIAATPPVNTLTIPRPEIPRNFYTLGVTPPP